MTQHIAVPIIIAILMIGAVVAITGIYVSIITRSTADRIQYADTDDGYRCYISTNGGIWCRPVGR